MGFVNSQILTVILCLILGVVLRRSARFDQRTPQVLNAFVICISLPSLVLVQLSKLLATSSISWDLAIPISMPWLLFLSSFAVFFSLGRIFQWPKGRTGALILLAGLGNTSFVGFPILESVIGEKAIPYGILVDQLGSFLVLSTAGIFVASFLSPKLSGKARLSSVARQVLTFPPFLALLSTILLFLVRIDASGMMPVFERLASTLVPVALVSVGFQIHFSWKVLGRHWQPLGYGLVFKLVLAPLAFYFLYCVVIGSRSLSTQVTVLESAMATMITAGVVAEDFGFDSNLVSLMLGISIPLSLITVPLWNHFLF